MKPCLIFFLAVGAAAGWKPSPLDAQTLREAADSAHTKIGAMILDADWKSPAQQRLVAREFNLATVGIFWTRTHPAREQWDWSVTDAAVDWARKNKLAIHLHPLLYPADDQAPKWLLESSPEDAPAILERHADAAGNHFRGRVEYLDVVNEPLAPDSSELRDCWWTRSTLGDNYILEAFRLARQKFPDVHLILNEHGCERGTPGQTKKWTAWLKLLKRLHDENLVDGAGWQLHTTPDFVLARDFALDSRMAEIAAIGLANHVTELDLPVSDDSPLQMFRQSEAAAKIAGIWTRRRSPQSTFTTWGVSDRHSWLPPVNGRSPWPLMFADDYSPKPFYASVRHALQSSADKAE